jgi:Domain of unknown function (DUF4160)
VLLGLYDTHPHRCDQCGAAFLGQFLGTTMNHPGVIAESYPPAVPQLSEFYGIRIYMSWVDHHPPHFHAIYAGNEAQVRIADGGVLAGTLPRTAARLVKEWAEARRTELMTNWDRAQIPETLMPIEPLK